MSDPFNGQLTVGGGNNMDQPQSPKQRQRDPEAAPSPSADPMRQGFHASPMPSSSSQTHLEDGDDPSKGGGRKADPQRAARLAEERALQKQNGFNP